jgi:periplasmic copper chaperone A
MSKSLRAVAAATAATACAVALAAPAAAHVKVSGTDATQGGWGVLTFRVPTESATASTTDLLVTLPDDHPIISVATQQKPGWIATVTKKTLATPQKDDDGNTVSEYIATVEWKAASPQAAIPAGQFDTFSISAGPLPKEASLSLPAAQTYSDGTVVNWNEKAAAGQPEPEHPAPTLTLAPGKDSKDSMPGMGGAPAAAAPASTDSTPTWPAVTALVVSVVALLLGLANLALLRRKN